VVRAVRVLIVDDAPEVRQELRTLLPLAGAEDGLVVEVVGEAPNGGGAVEQTSLLSPDVVLMDLEMTEMDGYAATQAIKTRHPVTRVVVLTVHGDLPSRRRAHEAGADEFVEKGASIAVLLQAIRGDLPTSARGGRA
jgi:DNA-binding NarL/FixJ family response regulator